MATNKPVIRLYFNYPFSLKNRRSLKYYLIQLFQTEQTSLEALSLVFCSDDQLLSLNQQYLSHDTFTDILTFRLSEPAFPLIAELYISIERIRDNAVIFHTSPTHELLRVIFHGCLHLCGYNDKTNRQKTAMTNKEDHYLSNYLKGST